jgi:integrase
LSVLWLTGCRPAEAFELQKKNININEDNTTFDIITKKLGFKKGGGFIIERRKLILKIPNTNSYIENLRVYLNRFEPEQRIFNFSFRTGEVIVERISRKALDVNLCPYNFRHSRMTLLAEKGATKEDLKRFKGSRSDRSVSGYIHARAVEYEVDFQI